MSEYYKITNPYDGIYRITSSENVFMELFVGEHHALLFDTGMGYGDLHSCVRSITDLPLYVVNSHGHPDHMGGNFQFDGEIFLHPDDIPLLESYNSNRQDFLPGEEDCCEGFDREAYINAPVGTLVPVNEGYIFDLGGKTFEVIEVPGHTAGSIALLYREQKILYVGDAINGWVWMFLRESLPLSVYRQTLRKTEGIDFDLLYTGHGPQPEPRSEFNKFIETADAVDFDAGIPDTSIIPQYQNGDVRICLRPGYTLADRDKPGFSAVLIDRDKL